MMTIALFVFGGVIAVAVTLTMLRALLPWLGGEGGDLDLLIHDYHGESRDAADGPR